MFLNTLLIGIFCFINLKIIIRDLREKIIPNRLLIGLIILSITSYFVGGLGDTMNINYFTILNIFSISCICFLLYNLGIWSPGDAKYLITLSMFLPETKITTIFGNLAIVVFLSLLLSYISFYLRNLLRYFFQDHSLHKNIYKDLKIKITHYISTKSYYDISISLIFFVIVFISMRLYKLYIINYLHSIHYNKYALWGGIILIFIFCVGILFLYKKMKGFFKYTQEVTLLFLWGLFIFFFTYEYSLNPKIFISNLYKVCTFYFIIFLIIQLIKYSINIYSGSDFYSKDISKLKVGDTIERKNFNKKIKPLLYNKNKILSYYNIPIYGNITLDKEVRKSIISLLRSINKQIRKSYNKDSIIKDLVCMRNFAFGPYIFLGFSITYIFDDVLIKYATTYFIKLFL